MGPIKEPTFANMGAALGLSYVAFAELPCDDAMDAAVLLAGDLNTTNIRQLGNIARAVFEFCDEPVHPFIFNATAPLSSQAA